MVDCVVKFQSNRVNFVSSRRFLIADYVIYQGHFFLCQVMLFSQFLDYLPFIYNAARFLRILSGRVGRLVKVCCSVVNCCELLVRQESSGYLVDLVLAVS